MPSARTDPPRWAPPLLAVQFLTRLPVPGLAGLSAGQARAGMVRAIGWLPLVGGMIGLVTAFVYVVAGKFWPGGVAIGLALGVEALLTGALHEDAVADVCDAFGGGRTPEDVRRILKDSRIGSYGALGLILAVALRATATLALPPGLGIAGIVGAATFGRLWAAIVMRLAPPAPSDGGVASGIGAIDRRVLAVALLAAVPGLAAAAWLAPWRLVAAIAAGAVALPAFAWLLRRRIGGSTGDCLGFAAYAGQLVLLLALSAG